jgi:hypothetical protein
VRQVATLLKFAQTTTDPKVAAGQVEKAADLKSQLDEASALPDLSALAPDIEPPPATWGGRPCGLGPTTSSAALRFPYAGGARLQRLPLLA